eukprot:Nitzschia sp. Nitz4//scaffold9_size221794//187207//188568//NITZ4_001377-RA/size221794-processed-gene-0.76-mRNA-1//-1//CDS//3329561094//4126//frame0
MNNRYILYSSPLLVALIVSCGFVAGFMPLASASSSDAVVEAAALTREIEVLKEHIETIEARSDTLEAATEQFRRKTKSLQTKLDEERERYDALLGKYSTAQVSHQEEIASMERYLDTAESARATAESWLETAMSSQRGLDSWYKDEIGRLTHELEMGQGMIDEVRTEADTLASKLKETQDYLSQEKLENAKHAQEMSDLRASMEDLKRQVDLPLIEIILTRIKENKFLESPVMQLEEFFAWLLQEVLPRWKKSTFENMESMQASVAASGEQASRAVFGSMEALQDGNLSVSLFLEQIKDVWETTAVTSWSKNYFQHFHSEVIPSLQSAVAPLVSSLRPKMDELQSKATIQLNQLASQLAGFYIHYMGERDGDVFLRGCQFIQTKSDKISLVLQVVLGLLALDFAISSVSKLVSTLKPQKTTPPLYKSPSSLSVRPSSPSLLRSSGSLSRRTSS